MTLLSAQARPDALLYTFNNSVIARASPAQETKKVPPCCDKKPKVSDPEEAARVTCRASAISTYAFSHECMNQEIYYQPAVAGRDAI